MYYALATWRCKAILSVGLRVHSHLSGGIRSEIIWQLLEIINFSHGFRILPFLT